MDAGVIGAGIHRVRSPGGLPARILFVDDERLLRETFAHVLSNAGHEIVTATDGLDALRKLETRAIDIVVLDVFMPTQDGIETLLALKRRPHRPIVIAISGNNILGMDFLEAAKKLGADYALAKPFTPSQLLALIDQCMRGGENALKAREYAS